MTSSSVPDTSPRSSSVPATERPRSSVPSTTKPIATEKPTVVAYHGVKIESAPLREYRGQRLGIRHWDGSVKEITNSPSIALAIIGGTKIAHRAPWSALEIVELD